MQSEYCTFQKSVIAALTLLSVCLCVGQARAIRWKADGVVLRATYTEPSTRTDGTPLTDLAKTNLHYRLPGVVEGKSPDIPATQAGGGGTVETTVFVPIVKGQGGNVIFWVTATDESGNKSRPSRKVMRLIDRR